MVTNTLSIIMVILTIFIMVSAFVTAPNFIHKKQNYFYVLLGFMAFILVWIFMTNNIFLFFLLWELELIPMYFLISIWGNKRAVKSALKFVLYTFGGSLFMLLGLMLICFINYANTGIFTTNITNIHIYNSPIVLQIIINILLLIGFGVKIPIVPLHRWLVDTHSNSSTPVSILLAGILLKLGVYGILKFNLGLVPLGFTYLVPVVGVLALINVIYGAGLAYHQKNIKKLIAASSISQMGIPLLGISSLTPAGINGAVYHLVSHGIVASGLFLIVGIIKNLFKTESICFLSGIGKCIPKLFGYSVLISFAGIGVPLLSGFVGEFLSIYGAVYSPLLMLKLCGIVATIVLILSALYILKFLHEVFYGNTLDTCKDYQYMTGREVLVLSFISVTIVILGCFPNIIIKFLNL